MSVVNNSTMKPNGVDILANNTFTDHQILGGVFFKNNTYSTQSFTMSLYGTKMDFRTMYNLEYTPKEGSIIPYTPPHDSNPVSSPWRQYLVPDESLKHLLPTGGEYEDVKCIMHRARIKDTPNLQYLKQLYSYADPTIYQKDFCKAGDFESKTTRNAKHISLPKSWKTPLTTQRCSYRDPQMGLGLEVEPPKIVHRDNLVPNAKEREILRVRTGESDYMAGISALGDFILKEKLHGKIEPSGISVWEIKRRLALLEEGIVPGSDFDAAS